jgi:hypothetical protein
VIAKKGAGVIGDNGWNGKFFESVQHLREGEGGLVGEGTAYFEPGDLCPD